MRKTKLYLILYPLTYIVLIIGSAAHSGLQLIDTAKDERSQTMPLVSFTTNPNHSLNLLARSVNRKLSKSTIGISTDTCHVQGMLLVEQSPFWATLETYRKGS